MNPINKAIQIVGSQTELARRIGVNQSTVSKWLNGTDIRAKHVKPIATATNGKITPMEIVDWCYETHRNHKQ
ncbi:helix-turn-helix domain-containing protein [Cronobacter sp. EKM101R]|uniref:transcriptional regulator n=1 Tax=Cronobacter TaxID=413496 RepID=UPI0013EBC3EB|nr:MULTISPECIES: YdaS family helix-turn-helix protein [Cronobacter]KAF6597540.1 helix-turn-helix domain-containing protein [Cronobacter sp. EKM101R]KAF6598552.1 helix-turn-helix domain-containing protein [Cronobacter sp. EKM102R]NUW55419.1 helix-turn-helix domain-containing protein [Cronobacter turicensis]